MKKYKISKNRLFILKNLIFGDLTIKEGVIGQISRHPNITTYLTLKILRLIGIENIKDEI